MNGYIRIKEASEKWELSEEKIEGAIKFGNTWVIPNGAIRLKDERIKSGKYIKKTEDN